VSTGTQYLDSHSADHFRLALKQAIVARGNTASDIDRLCYFRIGKTAAIVAGRQRIAAHDTLQYAEKLGLPPQPWGIETCPQCLAAPRPLMAAVADRWTEALADAYPIQQLIDHLEATAALLDAIREEMDIEKPCVSPLTRLEHLWAQVPEDEQARFLLAKQVYQEYKALQRDRNSTQATEDVTALLH